MRRSIPGWLLTFALILMAFAFGLIFPGLNSDLIQPQQQQDVTEAARPTQTPVETLLPASPLPTLTSSPTLLPPPTFEPATPTRQPSLTPTTTPTATIQLNADIPGLQGLPTSTVVGTTSEACVKRSDWKLEYRVQFNETLTMIANQFNTSIYALAEGNCLEDANVIREGQTLRVPGDAFPQTPEYVCLPFEALQPASGLFGIPGTGSLVFNWRGPDVPIYLLRIYPPNDGQMVERTIPIRQNETIVDVAETLPRAGEYRWEILALDRGYQEICTRGGPYIFIKDAAPTATPTTEPVDVGGGGGLPSVPDIIGSLTPPANVPSS